LFQSAVKHGYVRYNPRSDRIELLTEREIRAGLARPLSGGPVPDAGILDPDVTQRLLWRTNGAGSDVQLEIARHQRQRGIIAVRDANLTQRCTTQERNTAPDGSCPGVGWSIILDALDPANTPLRGGRGDTFPDPGVFAGLARRTGPTAGEWTVLSGSDTAGEAFRMRPIKVAVAPNTVTTIDVVGKNAVLEPAILAENSTRTAFCLPSDNLNRRLRIETCEAAELPETEAYATRFVFTDTSRALAVQITADAVRVPSVPSGIRRALSDARSIEVPNILTAFEHRIDDRFRLICADGECWPELNANDALRRIARDLVLVEARRTVIEAIEAIESGLPVNEAFDAVPDITLDSPFVQLGGNGRPELTDLARDLSLDPMLGVPGLNNGSYLNFLEALPAGVSTTSLQLTFDADMQRVAQNTFRSYLETRDFPVQSGAIPADLDEDRRAAFVVIDLQDSPGAIRAAVSYPFFSDAMSIWDLQALASGPEGLSPATPAPWRGLNSSFQPGSSMKILSALSLMRSALGENKNIPIDRRARIAETIYGASPATFQNQIGFSIEQAVATVATDRPNVAPPFSFRDRGEVPFEYPNGVEQACASGPAVQGLAATGRNYGICEALARSSNIFFGKMAVYENRLAIDALYDAGTLQRPFTGLGQTLRALNLHRSMPLVRLSNGAMEELSFAPRMEAAVLSSAPGLSTGDGPEAYFDFHERNVAINAYGQNALATPLALATTAGMIALNGRVKPFIAQQRDLGPVTLLPLFGEEQNAQAMLDELRLGMRAVVMPGGTGYNSFGSASEAARTVRDRVSGKTGTATLGITDPLGRTLITHWFVGWVNDRQGQPHYAFACAISHATGGSPCPAVTGAILGDLDDAGRL
jgi:cell division protein FtsI/penicillin-binding protein 2